MKKIKIIKLFLLISILIGLFACGKKEEKAVNLSYYDVNNIEFTQIVSGLGITTDNQVYSWGGRNFRGQGDGTNVNKLLPLNITEYFNLDNDEIITNVYSDYLENTFYALSSKGKFFAWGLNRNGQVGDSTKTDRYMPMNVMEGIEGNIVSVELMNETVFLFMDNKKIYSWGAYTPSINFQQVEKPTEISHYFDLAEDEEVISIKSVYNKGLALTSKGRIYAWYKHISAFSESNGFNPIEINNQISGLDKTKIIAIGMTFSNIYVATSNKIYYASLKQTHSNYNFFQKDISDGIDQIHIDNNSYILITKNKNILHFEEGKLNPNNITSFLGLNNDEEIINFKLCGSVAVLVSNQNRIFGWGYVFNEQNPTEITHLLKLETDETIEDFVIHPSNVYFLSSLKRIIAFGSITNNNYTLLYVPMEFSSDFPLNENEKIINVIGNSPSYIVTSENRIFIWGHLYGEFGLNGFYPNNKAVDITEHFDFQINEKVQEIKYYGNQDNTRGSVLLLTTDNRLLSWGYTRIIEPYSIKREKYPVDITDYLQLESNETIKNIYSGNDKYLVVTNTNRVIYWGDCTFLGTINEFHQPNYVIFDEEIIDIQIGYSHLLFLSASGNIFSTGVNTYNVLGLYTTYYKIFEITSEFSLKRNEKIETIRAFGYDNYAITSNGRIFNWGKSAIESSIKKTSAVILFKPTDITKKFQLSNSEKIEDIILGNNKLFVYTNKGIKELIYGDYEYYDITNDFNFNSNDQINSIYHYIGINYLLTTDGKLFVWGNQAWRKGGLGDPENPWIINQGLTLIDQVEMTTGSAMPVINAPNKDGYIFEDWYRDIHYQIPNKYENVPNKDIIFYAKFNKE